MGRGRSQGAAPHRHMSAHDRVVAELTPPGGSHPHGAHLYVLVGLPAAGKSHVARHLHQRWGTWTVQADGIRRLLGMHPGDHTAHAIAHTVARQLLADGRAVCLDANAATDRVRADLHRLAAECNVAITVVYVDAAPGVRAERMAARRAGSARPDEVDVPDEVLARMERGLQVPAGALRIDGTGDLAELDAALAAR